MVDKLRKICFYLYKIIWWLNIDTEAEKWLNVYVRIKVDYFFVYFYDKFGCFPCNILTKHKLVSGMTVPNNWLLNVNNISLVLWEVKFDCL